MNPKILNRDGKLPDDGFYQIEAPGEHVNHDAHVVQVIDAQAVESIVNRFNAVADASPDWAGLRVDKDHLSLSMENPTEALGWCMRLRNRAGVPEARIDWTALGLPFVESKPGMPPVYKFFSTEYEPADCEKLGTRLINRKTYDVVRPLRLDGLSLTNDPNNKGQRPISNRQPASAATAPTTTHTTMKQVNAELGLAEDAIESSAVTEIQKIKNRATTAETEVTLLKKEREALLAAVVDADLEKFSDVIENREAIKAQLITNRAGTIAVLDGLKKPAAATREDPARLTNRAGAKTPAGGPADEATKTAAAETRAAKINNRAREIQATSRQSERPLSYSQAFSEAERETPATDY